MQDTKRAFNPISISVAPTTRAIGKRYFDLPGTIELMGLLWQESVIDGFEFQNLCVFHLWDTWKEGFVPRFLQNVLLEIAAQYPGVKASVENVPTHLAGSTPFELVRQFEWITLDLRWAALYDELDRFELVRERLANVHLRGRLEGSEWMLDGAPAVFSCPNKFKAIRLTMAKFCAPFPYPLSKMQSGDFG